MLELGSPDGSWLNLTNIVLGGITLCSLGVVVASLCGELYQRLKARAYLDQILRTLRTERFREPKAEGSEKVFTRGRSMAVLHPRT
jgi:hypothetical protein